MGKYKRLSAEERWEIIHPIVEGKSTIRQVEKQKDIDKFVIGDWIRKYKQDGISGLENRKGWKHYSAELKRIAVEDVVLRDISKHYYGRKLGSKCEAYPTFDADDGNFLIIRRKKPQWVK